MVGGSVDWEVDMGKGAAGDHQPATVRSRSLGAPVRDAVMAGHVGDLETARALVGDDDAAVRAAALGALQRLGALGPDALLRALGDPDPSVRRRACTLAGRGLGAGPGTPAIVDALLRALASDPDPSVVECAAWALGEAGAACGPSRGRRARARGPRP